MALVNIVFSERQGFERAFEPIAVLRRNSTINRSNPAGTQMQTDESRGPRPDKKRNVLSDTLSHWPTVFLKVIPDNFSGVHFDCKQLRSYRTGIFLADKEVNLNVNRFPMEFGRGSSFQFPGHCRSRTPRSRELPFHACRSNPGRPTACHAKPLPRQSLGHHLRLSS